MCNLSRHILRALLFVLAVSACACRGQKAVDAGREAAEAKHETDVSITLTASAWAAGDIHTAKAASHVFRKQVTAPGVLEFNARRLAHLTARTPGRIERVMAVSGDRVGAGQVLAEVYSPDYMSLQAEYLQAMERAQRLAVDLEEAPAARAILVSARQRLLLVGATAAEVDSIGPARVPRPLLAVRAPFAGTVIEANVLAGDHVELGANLFRLADPSVLWASLHIREEDMASLQAGAGAELRTHAYPGEVFRGQLLLVGDVLDEKTRTLTGRVEVANPAGKLKTGMFVEAALEGGANRTVLAVPDAAVQDDDGRSIVFVLTGERRFFRREIATGERLGGQVEVLTGLRAGEEVATSGSFLLKSEMRKGSMEDGHGHS
ncbi:MAG: efflux RND transporter periplasmic adaptor subunit [Acidobacteriota bacterium]|nr:efflux RND transporter periplasmic adaptor subunit [Acidobacteriota bacterium]